MLTTLISAAIAGHWKFLPVVAMLLLWFFFSGFRTILRQREDRLVRELLLCLSSFGLLFSLLSFTCYGLVDPANHLARAGALPVSPEALSRFAIFGYGSFLLALGAGVALELRLRLRGESLRHG